jgi:hypothetical protein
VRRRKAVASTETCYMCDRGATTREHTPPLSFFPDGRRVNLITVPSCKVHNNDNHLDVEYVRNIIVTDINANQVAQDMFQDKVLRSYKRNPKLVQRTFQKVREVKIGGRETAITRLNQTRFNPILRAIAFALYFYDFKEKFQYRWSIYNATMLSEGQAFHDMRDDFNPQARAFLRNVPVADRDTNQPEVFKYGVFRQADHRVIYRLVFYGGVDIYAIGIPNDASSILD